MEETTKLTGFDDPVREKMVVTTNENGRLKMLSLWPRARQHDDEVDSSVNANPQLPQARILLPQVADPAREADGPSLGPSPL